MTESKNIGAKIDQMVRLKKQIQLDENKLKEKKQRYEEMSDDLLNNFNKQDLNGASGKLGSVSVTKTIVPDVEDWNKFFSYVHRNKAFDMLQRRVSVSAFRERLEAGKKVPGVVPFTKVDIRLNMKKKE